MTKDEYITQISRRGDRYGGHGGNLDMLEWCGKNCLAQVTVEELKHFLAEPTVKYRPEWGMRESGDDCILNKRG